ncbi:hypothetical protein ABZW30_39745 [Kitasatospora sp. NPDC004669]|uniref:hypothetical protein n=1 Tax=Kitasatospora sp. NPDC004669 TaxID=3154555 RepID=UPI0033B10E84
MRTTTKTVTYYLATDADGIIPDSHKACAPLGLADKVGATIDHPTPCQRLWYDEGPFSYFRTVTAAGEVLADVPNLQTWRLWAVEPLGTTGNWGERHYPYRRLAHRIRVIQEVESWQALGPRGREVLDLIDRQLPSLVRTWAVAFATDPDGVHQAYETWRLCTHHQHTSGTNALTWATDTARRTSRQAAAQTADRLARTVALAAADPFGPGAAHYAARRAEALAAAVLLEDRLTDYVLTALRGGALDQTPTAAA